MSKTIYVHPAAKSAWHLEKRLVAPLPNECVGYITNKNCQLLPQHTFCISKNMHSRTPMEGCD